MPRMFWNIVGLLGGSFFLVLGGVHLLGGSGFEDDVLGYLHIIMAYLMLANTKKEEK